MAKAGAGNAHRKAVAARHLEIVIPPRAGHFSTRKISNARFRDPISKLRKGLTTAIPFVPLFP
jgi:hypothetical protein